VLTGQGRLPALAAALAPCTRGARAGWQPAVHTAEPADPGAPGGRPWVVAEQLAAAGRGCGFLGGSASDRVDRLASEAARGPGAMLLQPPLRPLTPLLLLLLLLIPQLARHLLQQADLRKVGAAAAAGCVPHVRLLLRLLRQVRRLPCAVAGPAPCPDAAVGGALVSHGIVEHRRPQVELAHATCRHDHVVQRSLAGQPPRTRGWQLASPVDRPPWQCAQAQAAQGQACCQAACTLLQQRRAPRARAHPWTPRTAGTPPCCSACAAG